MGLPKLSKREVLQIKRRTEERMMAIAQEGKISPCIIGHVEATIFNGLAWLLHDIKKKTFYPVKKKLSKKLLAKQELKRAIDKKEYRHVFEGKEVNA